MRGNQLFTNQYVNLTNAPLSLAILSEVSYYWAVLLDNTNFGGASWTAYTSSNITANLGTNQGWHTVWVGLCGPVAGSQAAWNAVRLDLDLAAPILAVTNNRSVTIPMIQLQGYANEELAWLTYDLNNANGSVSNQPGFMTGAIFDTNSFTYTNNSFKCFDLMLANGANVVTLHASDLAGNCTNCTVTFNLNYYIMIIKITLISVCMFAFAPQPCFAQSNALSEVIHWGKSIQGAQLAVITTNNVVRAYPQCGCFVIPRFA
jgi:hypothetical protein